ncbi:hypothetical protein NOF63_07855 [Limosilactobacillus fermentum]|uniref:hypothetical protein n=1 Tax=Limosilactobacillus fermentum TaxID=1613 RepID=UPI0021031A0B|nr:hypothetical protein [Limosilactobacillus fermentum]MCQ2007954.1 hypothetical protein [Limosilactobacillus fermentum]
MKLKNVSRVAIVTDEDTANKLLSHGWKLLKVTIYASTDDRYLEHGAFQDSNPCLILGATKEIADHYPESEARKRIYD